LTTVIVANGDIHDRPTARRWLEKADRIVAADGGCRHCLSLGFPPDLLIGDLDSVTDADLAALQSTGTTIQRHPRRKDATDLELALHAATEIGDPQVIILGAVGGRWDQSLANFLILTHPHFSALSLHLIEGRQQAQLVRAGQPIHLQGEPGDIVSLIPLAGDAVDVATEGLEYPLQGETLSYATTRGVSNVLVGNSANVALKEGFLLVIHIGR
jgi:thiamine pyrophosphokinase